MLINQPKKQPVRDWCIKQFREFMKKNIRGEIGVTVETQELVMAIWFRGVLIFRKKCSLVLHEWVDMKSGEAFQNFDN